MRKVEDQIISSYAEALLKIAMAEDFVERVEEESINLKKILAVSKFKEFFYNPKINSAEKKDALREILEKEGISSITLNYLNLIVDQRRERLFSKIIEEFLRLVSTASGKVVAYMVSAIPLSSDIIRQMEERLSGSTGKEVEIKAEVDESIVGGFIIRMGNKVVDASLQKQLQMIKEEMLKK
ncbi:MAG: ATP synthase F1 subunit delta [Thermodesulfobacteriota bacterium]